VNYLANDRKDFITDIKTKKEKESGNTIIEGKIYKLCNVITHKVYIGQTTSKVKDRYVRHLYDLRRNTHNNPYLQNAWNKYRNETFWECKEIDTSNTKDGLDFLEIFYMEYYKSRNGLYGYNIKLGGSHGPLSEETKRKISKSSKGKNNGMYGKGYKLKGEKNGMYCVSLCGEKNGMYGKKHSEITKRKIGKKSVGRKTFLGRKHTQETRDKIKKSWILRKIRMGIP